MRFKTRTQKNKMGKTNTTNASTNWVPTKFKQTDLTKALVDGRIADGNQVIFPSTKRIRKPPSGFRVMFLAFLLCGLSFPAHEFLRGCRGDNLWGMPRAELPAGWRPRSLHGSRTRRPALPEGPAAPAAG
jgi:hypothetical protein